MSIDTKKFGSWDVFSLAKKLTILEFGIFFRGTFIDTFSSDQYWWFFEIELVVLAYFCLEYYGISKKKNGIIIFSCCMRLFWTLVHGICSLVIAYDFFHFGELGINDGGFLTMDTDYILDLTTKE